MSAAIDAPGTMPSLALTTEARGRPISFSFVPALDGLRAIAVSGVMLYHGGAPLVGGGFLGVNVFFVLSGFLITSLLLGEWAKRLTIRLGQFWTRRARRLLPALLLMLVGVAVYAKVFATPGEFANLRLDSLSTLFYVANWHFIFAGADYFSQTAQPSPVSHMWSLAIEEQFYIVWPPVVLVMLHLGRRLRPSRRLWPVFVVAVVGAVASAVDMRLSYYGGASITRLYEGTDTRSQDILVGATLASGMAIWAQHRRALPEGTGRTRYRIPKPWFGPSIKPIAAWEITPPYARVALQVLGWSLLAAGVYLWSQLTGSSAFLFEGGFLLFALGVATVIFCAITAQTASLSRALGNPVFRYVGKISYGIYLWHFPLFALLSASRMHLYGLPLLTVRIAVTLVVATASFYLVEEPIRRGRMRSFTEWRAWLMTSAAFLAVVAATVAATLPSPAEAVSIGARSIPAPVGSAYSGPPVTVTMFGDSLAFTAGWALGTEPVRAPYDVVFHSEGILGCGVMVVSDQYIHGVENAANGPCSSSSPASQQLPAMWAGLLRAQRPDVVMVMAGRWEVADQVIGGQEMHIGEPAYDAILRADLERAVEVDTSTGAYMMLLTAPCNDTGEQPNGQPWPEDTASRRLAYDRLLEQVAAEHLRNVEVYDLGAQVCPGGKFESTVNGVRIRLPDGIHFPRDPATDGPVLPTAKWLAWKLFPEAVRVGRLQMAGTPLQ
jgi:peptidoglycan/LPS O-acetylase OafA/YrhL